MDGAVVARGALVEGVSLGDRAVLVDAEHLPFQGAQRLRVGAIVVVTDGHEELASFAEVYGAAVVVGGAAQVVEPEDEPRAACDGPVAVRGNANHPVVCRVGGRRLPRVVEVDVVIIGEGRVEGDAQQAALARGVYLARDIYERRQGPVRLQHPKHAALFGHEEPALWRKVHRRRVREAADDPRVCETVRDGRGTARRAWGRPRLPGW